MDGEFARRKPGERSHREVVGAAVMDSELPGEVIERVKAAAGIKALLILAVAALHLAVVARGVGTDELVADTQLCIGNFKQSREISFAVGKTVGELKAVVGLDALYPDAAACIPPDKPHEKIGRGKGGLFGVGGQKAQASELVNDRVLKQAQLRV